MKKFSKIKLLLETKIVFRKKMFLEKIKIVFFFENQVFLLHMNVKYYKVVIFISGKANSDSISKYKS